MHLTVESNTDKLKKITPELPLRDHMILLMTTYFEKITNNEITPENIYKNIMTEVELPLLKFVMEYTGNNQSSAASILGLNRGTFRKKLNYYGIINNPS